jgi:hypothetical protein
MDKQIQVSMRKRRELPSRNSLKFLAVGTGIALAETPVGTGNLQEALTVIIILNRQRR